MCKRVGLLVQAQEKWHSGRPLSALSYLEEVTCFRQPRGPLARVPVALTDTVIVEVRGPREENGAGPGELAEWTGVGSPPADTAAGRGGVCVSTSPQNVGRVQVTPPSSTRNVKKNANNMLSFGKEWRDTNLKMLKSRREIPDRKPTANNGDPGGKRQRGRDRNRTVWACLVLQIRSWSTKVFCMIL